jgi:hypothetical protein
VCSTVKQKENLTSVVCWSFDYYYSAYVTFIMRAYRVSSKKNINDEKNQEVLEFKYLGSLITYGNDRGKDVRARITAGTRLFKKL